MKTFTFAKVYEDYRDHMLLKNYSKHTIKAYLSNFNKYNEWCESMGQDEIYDQDTVRKYLLLRVKNGASWQTMNNIYSAMRKLFREVLFLEWSMKKLPRPKKERYLPEMISQQEVRKIIMACPHLKHRAILVTLYATGIRAGELCRLKLDDIDSRRLQIRIKRGKGAKDRYVNIPLQLIEYLRNYYLRYKPQIFLFNGREKGKPMAVSSLRWPIRQAKKLLHITKKISPHTLRHCYATHHLENGTDLVFLQKNLGHKHIKTTIRYIHLCKNRYQHIHHPIADIISDLYPKTTG